MSIVGCSTSGLQPVAAETGVDAMPGCEGHLEVQVLLVPCALSLLAGGGFASHRLTGEGCVLPAGLIHRGSCLLRP